MTQQLADARQAVQQSMGQVDAARANLQTILDNLTAGVIVLDRAWPDPVVQPGRHAHSACAAWRAYEGPAGWTRSPGLADFAAAVQKQFDEFLGNAPPRAGPLATVV
jgi:hypothetical protein